MSNSSHIDKELEQVQGREKRAYTHLYTQLGLNPLPDRPSASTSLAGGAAPPPIPPRNPARGEHYKCNRADIVSCNLPQNEVVKQEQEQQAQHNSMAAEKADHGRAEETEASCADYGGDIDTEKKSNVIINDLSNAIGLALDEWKDVSNHN
ncbi:hypothetical protein M441DRAFT_51136 [Trichoderma asperellum CBS 433.97]|uniref:Uncharacterized protein n=1 Tax=Trichoderma asperellum (strain ATCC 204424 / CBS 433.97 / NBRC 101777) TaxID=1042311 RepID=A0A2T3YUZ5_TRIA4|nr:hypothetical protein M441DRAFT_51136 [Trichoderma asperellum CBS 433.97]PTB36400.1 hypothetical protein M441DRAFT_51136 [Trichoderma asperellum CBS 433.97]